MKPQFIDRDSSLPRVETGPVKFGDDWTGTFIRGDNAANYSMHLEMVIDILERVPNIYPLITPVLRGLLDDLKSSNEFSE